MKNLVIIAIGLLLFNMTMTACGRYTPQEGDMVFHFSKSGQSPYIALATSSIYTHCGIVVFKGEQAYVLEASNVVKLAPYDEWVKRGRWGHVKTVRAFEKPVKIKYQKYLGKKYDLAFKFGNDRYYCSELLYDIYLEQFDYQLAVPKKVKEYNLFKLDDMLKDRGIDKEHFVVAPSDILESDKVSKP